MNATMQTRVWATLAILSVSFTAPLYSQSSVNSARAAGASINPLSHAERAANLFGREIISSDNQKIGKVDNLVVDLESEHILYVVVDANHGKVAVLPEIFGESSGNTLKANVNKQKIDNAPQFTSSIDSPSELGQASFVDGIYQYFGATPWWKGSSPANQGAFHN